MEQEIASVTAKALEQLWIQYPTLGILVTILVKSFVWDTMTRKKYQAQDKEKRLVQYETNGLLRDIRDLLVAQTGSLNHVADEQRMHRSETNKAQIELRSIIGRRE